MVRSDSVMHDLKSILGLAVLSGVALAGCGESIKSNPPQLISVSLFPAAASLQAMQSQQFTATVQNDAQNRGVIWGLTQSGATCIPDCGQVVNTGVNQITYSTPGGVPNPETVMLTATSVADNTKSVSAVISITVPQLPISVELSLTTASVPVTQAQLFTVNVLNDTQNKGVTWGLTQSGTSCTPTCGALVGITSEAATFDSPAHPPNQSIVTLTATSVADSTKSTSAMITITVPSVVLSATIKLCDDEIGNPDCTSKDNFSLAQIRDLFIWVNWQNVPTGSHTQELDFFLPQGHVLYLQYLDGFQITGAPTGSASVMRVWPVGGTWITQRQLTGTWEIDVSIDGQVVASKMLQFYSGTQ